MSNVCFIFTSVILVQLLITSWLIASILIESTRSEVGL